MAPDIWSLIVDSLRTHAGRPAWVCRLLGGKRLVYRYAEIEAFALDLAARLRERGVARGDVIAIFGVNGPEWGVGALAVWRLGAILAPLHVTNTDEELTVQLAALKPKLILTHGADRRLPGALAITLERDATRIARAGAQTVDIAPQAEAVYSCTSGSTGVPKIVRLSHANIVTNVRACAACACIDSGDRFLSLLPLSHMFAVTGDFLLPLHCGAAIVVPRALAASEILESLAQERITIVIAVPKLYRNLMLGLERRLREAGAAMAVYRELLKRLPAPLRRRANWPIRRKLGGSIKAWISGGSRLDPEIMRYFRDLGISMRQGYGLTETAPVVSLQQDFEPVLDSVGRPLEGVEVKVHDADAAGSGELWVRGPNIMLGYADPKQTQEVMRDGWFRTGDLARIDACGNIVLTGRCKRLIVTEAGKNVYPEEVETLLERVAGVKEAAVIEIDMRPAALLAVEGPGQVEQARRVLREYNARVATHNHIARFALVDELPRTPLGKIALTRLPGIFAEKEITR